MKGFWRSQPIVAKVAVDHVAPLCASCGASLTGSDLPRRCLGAHHVLELERDPGTLRVRAEKHRTFAVTCRCGAETVKRPGEGTRTGYEGRKRDLQLRERCLVGPMLRAVQRSLHELQVLEGFNSADSDAIAGIGDV